MKEIEESFSTIKHSRAFYVQTDDGDRYVFYHTPWSDKPIFSHRYYGYQNGEGERDYGNRLPDKIKEILDKKFGGYFKQTLEEV